MEAQACYSLGNTYTLLQDYERAAEYHLRHLLIAQELADRCATRLRRWEGACPARRAPSGPCSRIAGSQQPRPRSEALPPSPEGP